MPVAYYQLDGARNIGRYPCLRHPRSVEHRAWLLVAGPGRSSGGQT
jgi:hypothetical protein